MEHTDNKSDGRIWTGLFLITAGLLLLAFKLGAPIPGWLVSWPVALIALGTIITLRHRFRHPLGFILIIIGSLNLVNQFIPALNFRHYYFPLAIIIIGVFFLLRPKRGWRRREWMKNEHLEWKSDPESRSYVKYDRQDYIDATCFLGGAKKIVVSKNFKGGDITCFMGGAEINLLQADIEDNAVMDITVVFGGCKIIVPAHWDIKSEMTVTFGNIDDKRALNPGNVDPKKVLVLQGTALFGGIDIRSY